MRNNRLVGQICSHHRSMWYSWFFSYLSCWDNQLGNVLIHYTLFISPFEHNQLAYAYVSTFSTWTTFGIILIELVVVSFVVIILCDSSPYSLKSFMIIESLCKFTHMFGEQSNGVFYFVCLYGFQDQYQSLDMALKAIYCLFFQMLRLCSKV